MKRTGWCSVEPCIAVERNVRLVEEGLTVDRNRYRKILNVDRLTGEMDEFDPSVRTDFHPERRVRSENTRRERTQDDRDDRRQTDDEGDEEEAADDRADPASVRLRRHEPAWDRHRT